MRILNKVCRMERDANGDELDASEARREATKVAGPRADAGRRTHFDRPNLVPLLQDFDSSILNGCVNDVLEMTEALHLRIADPRNLHHPTRGTFQLVGKCKTRKRKLEDMARYACCANIMK